MTAPEHGTGFAERVAEVCPGFRVVDAVRRARKSEFLPGEVDGAPVIAKRLLKSDPVWDWYFAREVAVYRAFAAGAAPFRVPHVYATAHDVLVIERFPEPLARVRRPYAELAPELVHRLSRLVASVASCHAFPADPAPPEIKGRLQQRLLEDPVDIGWVSGGLARARQRELIDDDLLAAAREALKRHAPVSPHHGDVLLRNVMVAADGDLVLVDWECAGNYVAHWDDGLLWTQLGPASRAVLEHEHAGEPLRAMLACAAFALCRELVFLDAFRTPDDHAGRRRVEADLEGVARRLLG